MKPDTIPDTAPWVIAYSRKDGSGIGLFGYPDGRGPAVFVTENMAVRVCNEANDLWPDIHHEVCKVVRLS